MEAISIKELPRWAKDMLMQARVGRLGLLDDRDRPRVLPVTFAVLNGDLWTVVDDKPKRVGGASLARVRYLRRRPEAALTVDHYDDDWDALAWVQALGRMEIVEPETVPAAAAALRAKYEPYRRRPPAGPLLRLRPQRFLCWRAAG